MRVALVALALVLAGCPAVSQPSPTPTVTPAPVPDPVEYPPGMTEDGITDPDRLAEVHAERTDATSYTLVSNRTMRYENGSIASQLFLRLHLTESKQYVVDTETEGPEAPVFLGRPPAKGEFWSNGSVYVVKLTRDNSTRYNEFTTEGFVGTWRYWRATVPYGGQAGHARSTFSAIFRDVPTTVTGRSTVDGLTRFRVRGETPRSTEFAQEGAGPVRNVSLVAVVDEIGIIRRFDMQYETTVNGEPVRFDWSIRYSDIGETTAQRPPWFERAVNESR
jgi:hypothetical protein